MYKCEFFGIKELVSPRVFESRGLRAWQLLDTKLLRLVDFLRLRYGSCVINDWSWGGDFKESGLRTHGDTVFSTFSQHSFGRAADLKFTDISAEDIRQECLSDEHNGFLRDFLKGNDISVTFEEDVSWLHVDVRNARDLINSFKP